MIHMYLERKKRSFSRVAAMDQKSNPPSSDNQYKMLLFDA